MKLMVNGREFEVTTERMHDGRPVYELRGKRGAHYFTMRNVNRPEAMFLCNARGFGPAGTMDRVWLTDEGGALRQVR